MRQSMLCLAAVAVVTVSSAQPAVSSPAPVTVTNLMPTTTVLPSPVKFFRELLAMPPAERLAALAKRTPESRAVLAAKVREYLKLDPAECELRLRATELRWYLTPLLHQPAENRAAQLARVPPDMLQLVKSRLTQWDILPPPLKAEFLANDKTLNYVAHIGVSNGPAATPQQQKITEQFNDFLALTAGEKRKLLATLSAAEQAQMDKTLKAFEQLPAQQRATCERNYAKFAGMSDAERAEFLKNAENWSKMSPAERKTWRDLVANVPLWPPVPTSVLPRPHTPPEISKAGFDKN